MRRSRPFSDSDGGANFLTLWALHFSAKRDAHISWPNGEYSNVSGHIMIIVPWYCGWQKARMTRELHVHGM